MIRVQTTSAAFDLVSCERFSISYKRIVLSWGHSSFPNTSNYSELLRKWNPNDKFIKSFLKKDLYNWLWRQKEMQRIWRYALRKIRLWTTNLLVFKCTINRACFGRKSAKLFDAELTTSLLIRLLERKGKLVQDGGLVQPSPSSDQVVQRARGCNVPAGWPSP